MLKRISADSIFILLACMLAVAIYWPGLGGGYALDDFNNIVQNDALTMRQLSLDELSRAAFSFQAGPTMRPLSMISFALNNYFFGADAYSFKVTNLVIHLINGLLVFLLLQQLLAAYRRRYAPQVSVAYMHWTGLLVGALWLLHPLNVLPVLYVVQRETSLSGLFVLLGINLYLWARERQTAGRPAAAYTWTGIPLLTVFATLCKESGALLPIYLLVIEIFIFRFRKANSDFSRSTAAFYLAFLLLPGCLGFLTMMVSHDGAFLSYAGRSFSLPERLMSENRVIWLYIRWTLLPDEAALGLYHDDIAVSRGLLQPFTTLLSILGIAALVTLCLLTRRRRPLLALGIAWFLCGQLLESTIFPLELAYEHRNYLPDLGLLLALAALIRPEYETGALMRASKYALLAALLCLFAWITWQRASHWSDNLAFAKYEAQHHPQSAYATYMLGQTYANMALFGDHGSYNDAVGSLTAASEVPNASVIADVSLILVESQLRDSVEPGVFDRITDKLSKQRITASDLQALEALVDCVDKRNCRLNPADVDRVFRTALTNPQLARAASAKANILVIYGNFIAAQAPDDTAAARELMAQAAALVPQEPQYRANLVTMDIALKDPELARQDLDGLRKLNYLGHLDAEIAIYAAEIGRLSVDRPARKTATP